MLKKAVRLALATLALLSALAAPLAGTAHADCSSGSTGAVCPR